MNALTPITAAQPMLPLVLPETRTFDEWSSLGRVLLTARRKLNWLVGDWLDRGLTLYGDKARDEANRIYRSDVDRFAPILETCRRFPELARHETLTFEHHAMVRDLDGQEAEKLLVRAERSHMTVAAFKAEVRVSSNRQTTILEDDDPEDTAMRRIVQAWNQASKSAREAFLELVVESDLGGIDL